MDVTPTVRMIPDRRNGASREQLLRRIRAEFEEMPCLRLTCGQARRLFGLRSDVCDRVLATLVDEHTLTRGLDDRYGLRDADAWHAREPRAIDPQRCASTAASSAAR
jgi:hypothetical protein